MMVRQEEVNAPQALLRHKCPCLLQEKLLKVRSNPTLAQRAGPGRILKVIERTYLGADMARDQPSASRASGFAHDCHQHSSSKVCKSSNRPLPSTRRRLDRPSGEADTLALATLQSQVDAKQRLAQKSWPLQAWPPGRLGPQRRRIAA